MRRDARRRILAIALMAAGVGAVYAAASLRPVALGIHVDLSGIPLELCGLKGVEVANDPDDMAYLEADAMRTLRYGEGADSVEVSVIYGVGWRTVHTPEGCFPSQGWAIAWERALAVTADNAPHPGPLQGKLMRVEREGEAMLVLFVFAHKGGTSADWAGHSWAVATGPPGAGGLSVMLTARVLPGREDEIETRLCDFMRAVYPHAVGFWYRDSG